MENIQKLKDEELVRHVLKNPEYFGYLMDRYEMKLLIYIRRLLQIEIDDAQDILQEVFIKTYENINAFDTKLKFSSWIYRIAHNQAISHYRKIKNKPTAIPKEDNEKILLKLSSELDIKEEVEKNLNAKQIGDLLKQLDKKYREVLILKFLEDKDYTEISDILKKPMGTIATLMNRAKSKFKTILISNGYNVN